MPEKISTHGSPVLQNLSVLIPACADLVKKYKSPLTGQPVQLVAAGGIYDGRGIAASLMVSIPPFPPLQKTQPVNNDLDFAARRISRVGGHTVCHGQRIWRARGGQEGVSTAQCPIFQHRTHHTHPHGRHTPRMIRSRNTEIVCSLALSKQTLIRRSSRPSGPAGLCALSQRLTCATGRRTDRTKSRACKPKVLFRCITRWTSWKKSVA